MNKMLKVMFLLMLIFAIVPASHAGKVDDVKKAVKDKCSKELPEDSLMDSAMKAFDCQPSQDVTIQGCTIKCLKANSGNVVGG